VTEEEARTFEWPCIKSSLQDLGYIPSTANDTLTTLGEHFPPKSLKNHGKGVDHEARIFKTELAASATTASMWNAEPCKPFRYDYATGTLCAELPLLEHSIIDKLRNMRQLSETEVAAVQNLYFAPLAVLAPFAAIFSNFEAATRVLIHEPSEEERFRYFQEQFALFYRRCEVIADHLAKHGGAQLRRAANEVAQRSLPGAGWRFFDIRYEFPDAWNLFQHSLLPAFKKNSHPTIDHKKAHLGPELHLPLNRNMFPFLVGRREISIVRVQLLIQAPEDASIGEYIHVKYHHAKRSYRKAKD
jgi:hypothetical protein